MKRILLTASAGFILALLASAQAQAQTATGTGTATSNSNSGAVAISGGGQGGAGGAGGSGTATSNSSATGGNARGGNSSIIFNTPGSTSSTVRTHSSGSIDTTPNAIAPGLGSAAIETCYGPGVAAGLAVTGFGASFGMGQYDSACNRRLNARTLYAFGGRYREVAIRIMANEPEVQQAMADAGLITLQPGDVQYRGPARAYGGAPVRAAASGCHKWSGGATGVGSCLY